MKSKSASVAVLFCVPLIPLAALPVAQRVKAYAAAQKKLDEPKHKQEKAQTATKELLRAVELENESRFPAVLEELLAQGADINARIEYDEAPGQTALFMAIIARPSTQVARALLDHGIDVDARDRDGATALVEAIDAGKVEFVQLLLSRGAKVNYHMARWGGRSTPLSEARRALRFDTGGLGTQAIARRQKIIQLLKAAGAKE